MNTSTNLDRRTIVVARSCEAVKKVNILEDVSVDDEGTPASAAANKIMPGVADDKTKVVLASKVDAGLDVSMLLGEDNVDTVVAKGAWLLGILGESTSGICEVLPQVESVLVGSGRTTSVRISHNKVQGASGFWLLLTSTALRHSWQ